ncbi:transketolase [Cnuibacter physcomitrellae]|uniref:Transketolase n=1 Tax=Cnuibacter physcomitrellae TaxID=1619308 RepID=A0A1X9LFG1_9MICO|nr:transketolase [Cnuibacter physcomitrellae]ARJ03925.1 transketolase [Cnuibacter physcomitrellae]GGI39823.1 transketolase [Cnuibacter physcomitrellae]
MPSATTLLPDRPRADDDTLADRAAFVRTETIRLIELAKVGHYSSVFSAAEIFAALYYGVMRTDPTDPGWQDRDRFLMGKGHAAVGLFPILADLGYFPSDVLDGYTRLGSPLGDHPDMTKVPGIDFSSGSIGHALSNGLGMALGGRMAGRDFSVFVMLGDGEMQEGQVWEAALAGAHHRLGKLVAIVDRNGFQLDGSVDDVVGIEPLADKWQAFGWEVHEVDGHDAGAVRDLLLALAERPAEAAPSCVIARTRKGKGVRYMEEEPGWHLGYLTPADAAAAVAEIRAGLSGTGARA